MSRNSITTDIWEISYIGNADVMIEIATNTSHICPL